MQFTNNLGFFWSQLNIHPARGATIQALGLLVVRVDELGELGEEEDDPTLFAPCRPGVGGVVLVLCSARFRG